MSILPEVSIVVPVYIEWNSSDLMSEVKQQSVAFIEYALNSI